MEGFISTLLNKWPLEEYIPFDDLAIEYERLRLYRKLVDITNANGVSEQLLKLWIYFSHLELGKSSETVFFIPGNTYIDKNILIPPKVIEELKSVILEYMTVTKKKLKTTKQAKLEVKEIKHGVLFRGKNVMGVLDDFPPEMSEEDMELVMIQSNYRLEPKLIDSTYYSYLYENWEVNMHVYGNHRARYYKFFGSFKSTDVETDLGDLIVENNLDDIVRGGGNFEVNLTHFDRFHTIMVKYLVEKYLSIKGVRMFVTYNKTFNENYATLYKEFVDTILEVTPSIALMVLKSPGLKSISDEEITTFKIIFGYKPPLPPITLPLITSFEKAVLMGRRAENIKDGAKPQVPVKESDIDFIEIAEREIKSKRLPNMKIVRLLPDKTREEFDPNQMLW